MIQGDETAGSKVKVLRVVARPPDPGLKDVARRGEEEPPLVRPSAIDILVGREIARQRDELGMTRQALGDALGVSAEMVGSYELGQLHIGPKLLVTLAHRLRCYPSAFFRSLSDSRGVDATRIRGGSMVSTVNANELETAQDRLLDAIDDIYALLGALTSLKRSG